jgi:hypothetical protein
MQFHRIVRVYLFVELEDRNPEIADMDWVHRRRLGDTMKPQIRSFSA